MEDKGRVMEIREELDKLREEHKKRNHKGWDDYEWCTGRGDFVEGQINILERLLKGE